MKDTARCWAGCTTRSSTAAPARDRRGTRKYAGVPVFNGLTDEYHPTQMLADVLTMTEHCSKALQDISYVFVGDGRNNMGNSLLLVGAKLGMDVRILARNRSRTRNWSRCAKASPRNPARITITDDLKKGVKGVDFIHTDVWVSMGEPIESWGERIKLLMPYQVNAKMIAAAGNPRVQFMHCRRRSTTPRPRSGLRSPPSTRS